MNHNTLKLLYWLEHLENTLSYCRYWMFLAVAFEQLHRPFDFTIKRNFNSAICHAECSCAVHCRQLILYKHTHMYTQSYFNAVTFSEINKTCLKWQPAFHAIKLLSLNAEKEREREKEKKGIREWQCERQREILNRWQNVCGCEL